MKKYLIAGVVTLAPFAMAHAASDYYLKLDTIKGESSASNTNAVERVQTNTNSNSNSNTNTNTNTNANVNLNTNSGSGAGTDLASPMGGESKGKVEIGWKVEEGTKAAVPGVEPDEIDVADDSQPLTPDFSILLGGGSGSDDSEGSAQGNDVVEKILLEGMQADDMPTESVSLNFGKIKTTVKQTVRLLGFIPVPARATIEIDANQKVKVKFPWWALFAGGKNSETLGQQVFNSISNVLKTKHDTIKNAMGNVR